MQKLIESLGGEKDRWTQPAKQLSDKYTDLSGDVLIAAGVVAYLGLPSWERLLLSIVSKQ